MVDVNICSYLSWEDAVEGIGICYCGEGQLIIINNQLSLSDVLDSLDIRDDGDLVDVCD